MKVNDAVSQRILQLCEQNNLTINGLATKCMITQSTVDHIISGASANPKLLTIIRICAGLNITLVDFFNNELFNDIELEL